MSESLGESILELSTRDQNFSRGVDRAEKKAQRLNRTFRTTRRIARSVSVAIVGIGTVAVTAGGLALRSFARFEQGLVEVEKTADLTEAQTKRLGGEIGELARRLPIATKDLLGIATAAGQVGVQGVDNIVKFTETLGQLQLASDVVGEQGARSLARLLNITQESTDNVDRLGSVITELGNTFAATESEIIRFSTFLGSATAQFNLSSAEIAGLSAALAAAGQRAETSGSATGAALQEINTALAEGGEEAKRLAELIGVSIDELRRNFEEDAVEALLDFSQALGNLPAAEQTKVLDSLNLAGRETVRVINALIKTNDDARRAVRSANTEFDRNQALTLEAARASDTFSSQMQIFANRIDQVLVKVGRELAPVILDATEDISDFIDEMTRTGELQRFAEAVSDLAGFLFDVARGALSAAESLGTLTGRALFPAEGGVSKLNQELDTLVNKNLSDLEKEIRKKQGRGTVSLADVQPLSEEEFQAGLKRIDELQQKSREVQDKQANDLSAITDAAVEGAQAASNAIKRAGDEGVESMERLGSSIEFSISRNLTDAIVRFQDFGRAAQNILNAVLSGLVRTRLVDPIVSGFSLPGFQDGGRPAVGQPAIVGERGPELFVPDRAGTVIPNERVGGVNVDVNIDARGSDEGVINRLQDLVNNKVIPQAIAGSVQAVEARARRPRFA